MGNLNFTVEEPKERQQEELQSSYEDTPIPEGTYKVEISKGVIDDNKRGTGQWLRLHFTILEGPQSNEEFVQFFNFEHKNEDTQRIAKEQLSSVCLAVGIDGTVDDSEDLYGKQLLVDLKIEQGKDKKMRNRVTKYKSLPAAAAPVAPAQETSQASGSPPWSK